MHTYKVTKVFHVQALSKQDAVEQVTNNPGELLEFVSVVLQTTHRTGWKVSFLKQLKAKA